MHKGMCNRLIFAPLSGFELSCMTLLTYFTFSLYIYFRGIKQSIITTKKK